MSAEGAFHRQLADQLGAAVETASCEFRVNLFQLNCEPKAARFRVIMTKAKR